MQVIICGKMALLLTRALQYSTSKGSVSIQLFRGLTRVILRCNDCHAIMQRSEQSKGFDIYSDRKMACVQEVRRASRRLHG